MADDAERILYAGPRGTFIERRKELAAAARRDGDRERAKVIAGLRKPTAAAHCVNLLAQSGDDALDRLLDLGGQIRRAFADGDDEQMRTLLQQRAAVVGGATARARSLSDESGEPASGAVVEQVTQTLRAAMASDEAADEVRSGMLTDALDEPGFAVLGVGSGSRVKRDAEVADRTDETAALAEAESAAEKALQDAERLVTQVAERRDELERRRAEAASVLAKLDEELDEVKATEVDAEAQRRRAVDALDEARRITNASGSPAARTRPRVR